MFTAIEAAVVFAPREAGNWPEMVERLEFPVVCRAEVAAPEGRGRDAADTGRVGVLGDTATTKAVSVATGAVDAALIVAEWVPSLISVVWAPSVV
jgi:hypothetical protein